MDGGSKVTHPIKKATVKVASFIKRLQNLNFNSEQEIIEGYQLDQELAYYESRRRQKRFGYYFNVFELKETCFLDDLTEQQKEQYSLIWKLVDLEDSQHE
jgi:hypothetical protein